MKNRKMLQLGLVTVFALGTMSMTSSAVEGPIECGLPLDVYEGTALPDMACNLPLEGVNVVENQYLLSTDGGFDGILTEKLKDLGIVSLEEIFNSGDYLVYLASCSEDSGNVKEELEKLQLFLSVEENFQAELMYSVAPTLDCDLSHLHDEEGNDIGADEIPQGMVYEYVMDENGDYVVAEDIVDLTEAFDPEGEPMPEGAFASPAFGNTGRGNWLTRMLDNIFSFFFS